MKNAPKLTQEKTIELQKELYYLNEAVESDASEKLEKMEDERYIMLPKRFPKDDLLIMESFVYGLEENNFEDAEKFYGVLEGKKPFRNFKALLSEYPELREKWFLYKNNHIKNETINWLCDNNIELENQQLIPVIEILQLKSLEDLPKEVKEELKGFKPAMCLNCQNKENLIARLFLTNLPPENLLIEKETKRLMRELYGVEHYGNFTGGKKDILTASKCPKCGNEDIIWDY